ncbi:MAG: glycosyltransferase family 2 protein [Candidatus Gracilibacteria bacterium]|nr:glycosyltransferase family 2 protein [Candidatus Gracilibacteria bacterium]
MNNNELVSIIIPTYNREKIIGETIECAINQSYKNIEIIIGDNYSTDNTFSIIEKYAKNDNRITLFKNKENLGPVRNWQECINKAKGKYLKILWSDDLISKDFIEETIKLFDKDTAFVFTTTEIFYNDGKKHSAYLQKNTIISSKNYIEKSVLNESDFPLSPGCAIFRTIDVKNNLIIEIDNNDGLIFNKYGAGNDLLIFLLTAINYKYVKHIQEVKSYFRAHKGSISCTNDINLYYEWARKYVSIIYNNQKLKNKFKTKIYILSIFFKNYKNINLSTEGNINFNYFFKKVFSNIYLAIKNKII